MFIWDTTDGNVILQTGGSAEGLAISLFLTSSAVRDFEPREPAGADRTATYLRGFSEAEIQHWLHLRAIEWATWPAFVTQPVIPILFISFPIPSVVIGLLIADFLWRFIRYRGVVPRLARAGTLFSVLKRPSAIGSAIYIFTNQRQGVALLAFLWPLLAVLVSAPVTLLASACGHPTLVGLIELELAKRVGYVSRDTEQ
jgi:hypothetical protein